MIAQSIVTNVNKSLYVTIGTSPFLSKVRRLTYRPNNPPGKDIIFLNYIFLIFLPVFHHFPDDPHRLRFNLFI